MPRPNLQVWTGAHINRVVFDGVRATGVEIAPLGGGEPVTAQLAPGGEVVLATGSIGSAADPAAVGHRRPGAARGERASRRAVALPGVGANLQDHLQIRAVYGVEGARTLNTMAATLWGKALIGLHYAWKRSGPMSMAPSQLGAFTRSSPERAHPNLEYHVQPLSLDAFGEPLHRIDAFTASVCNLNPTSRGHVRIRSADPATPPRIAPDYLSTDDDRHIAAQSLRVTRRIVAQPALAPFKPKEIKPGVQFESDADLATLAGDIGTTIFHPVGTAKMGPASDPDGGRRRAPARPWRRRASRRRRQRHADDHERQHQRPDPDDRRARRRVDPARRGVTRGRGILFVRWFERGSR